jgi:hypothetical protein
MAAFAGCGHAAALAIGGHGPGATIVRRSKQFHSIASSALACIRRVTAFKKSWQRE